MAPTQEGGRSVRPQDYDPEARPLELSVLTQLLCLFLWLRVSHDLEAPNTLFGEGDAAGCC